MKLPFLACLSRWHDFSSLLHLLPRYSFTHSLPLCFFLSNRHSHTHTHIGLHIYNYIINFLRSKWSCSLTYLFSCWLICMWVCCNSFYFLSVASQVNAMQYTTRKKFIRFYLIVPVDDVKSKTTTSIQFKISERNAKVNVRQKTKEIIQCICRR